MRARTAVRPPRPRKKRRPRWPSAMGGRIRSRGPRERARSNPPMRHGRTIAPSNDRRGLEHPLASVALIKVLVLVLVLVVGYRVQGWTSTPDYVPQGAQLKANLDAH